MATQKTLTEQAIEMIAKETKSTKIVSQENATGISFFEGKKRLVKVLKSKTGISLEINVYLDEATEKEYGLTRISRQMAHEKHLGTMKYMARLNDIKLLPNLLKAAVTAFKAEVIAEKAAQEAAKAQ